MQATEMGWLTDWVIPGGRRLGLIPLIGLLSVCSATSNPSRESESSSTKDAQLVTTTSDASFRVGINVGTINWWDGSRPFENLIYGTGWQMQNTKPWGGFEEVPDTDLDNNGWVKSAPSGYRIARGLSVPVGGGSIVCRYQGHASLEIVGPVSKITSSTGEARFTIARTYPNPRPVTIYYYVDPINYLRNLDCRELNASVTALLAPEFIDAMTGFKVVRFMKWQRATEGNWPVSWATRNKPGDGDYIRRDGVPVETIVSTANQLGVDPWVTVPWNADDDYVVRFATYIRDNLSPGHQVYVEVSNEVWNGGYPVAKQAANEAETEKLPNASGAGAGGNLERYAEKTKQVMSIWSKVFAGQKGRLVRVASFQHVSPYYSNSLLNYMSLYRSIDALATAPYFAYDLTDKMTLEQMLAALPGKVDDAVRLGVQQKSIARKYGLRYVTYEAGQSIVLPNNLKLLRQVETDARMGDAYTQFLTTWKRQIGDTFTLFALTGPISEHGAWGLSSYDGEPSNGAPKKEAVDRFLEPAPALRYCRAAIEQDRSQLIDVRRACPHQP